MSTAPPPPPPPQSPSPGLMKNNSSDDDRRDSQLEVAPQPMEPMEPIVYTRNPSGLAAMHGTTTRIRIAQVTLAALTFVFLVIGVGAHSDRGIGNGWFYTALVISILSTLFLIACLVLHLYNEKIFGPYADQFVIQRIAREMDPPAFNTAMTTNNASFAKQQSSLDPSKLEYNDRYLVDIACLAIDFALGLLNGFACIILIVKSSASILVILAVIFQIFSSVFHLAMSAYSYLLTNIDHAEY